MADTSADLGAMGEQEIAEGAVGLEAAGQLADQDDEPADDVDVAQEQYESVEEGLAEDQDQES
jgi:hypothetical protein